MPSGLLPSLLQIPSHLEKLGNQADLNAIDKSLLIAPCLENLPEPFLRDNP